MNSLGDAEVTKKEQKERDDNMVTDYHFQCENCKRIYKSRNGLWKHKNNCNNAFMIIMFITN